MWKPLIWVDAVRRHWGILVTSGALIGALGIWQGLGHAVHPTVYWVVAIGGVVLAFYRAWVAEYDAKEKANHELSALRRLPQSIGILLKSDLQHAGKITKHRLGIRNNSAVPLDNLKLSVTNISPWDTEGTYAAYNIHFPFRLWRGLGTETEGCLVNPEETEWFDLFRWWISGSPGGDVVVELDNKTLEGPRSQWQIELAASWAQGKAKFKVFVSSNDGVVHVEFAD